MPTLAIVDRVVAVYAKLWQVLEADTGWATIVPANNRVKHNTTQLVAANTKLKQLKPADFPRVEIELGDMGDELDGRDLTFADARGQGCFGRDEILQQDFIITIWMDGTTLTNFHLVPLTIGLLRNADLSALTYIDSIGRITAQYRKSKAFGALRRTTTLRVPVQMTFNSGA